VTDAGSMHLAPPLDRMRYARRRDCARCHHHRSTDNGAVVPTGARPLTATCHHDWQPDPPSRQFAEGVHCGAVRQVQGSCPTCGGRRWTAEMQDDPLDGKKTEGSRAPWDVQRHQPGSLRPASAPLTLRCALAQPCLVCGIYK